MLVFEFRLVDYNYFLDVMQPYELTNIFEFIPYADRNQWEQCRLKIFSTASMFSKGNLTVQDIMQFPWDAERKEETTQEITGGDIERLKRQVKLFEKTLNDGRL